ncbi:MAG: hypothetical protein H0V51_23540 [Chloroflexi bacterium]|nr:hypothetical protein [Chloroflexota bacterium]
MPLVSLEDLDAVERVRGDRRAAELSRLAAQAAREVGGPEPSEEEIVAAVRSAREALYRERSSTG